MNKRETFKEIEIKGRKFRINKFDALTGSYIAYTLMNEVLPMGLNMKAGIPMPKNSTKMTKEAFSELQKDCLRVCGEMLDAGFAPVIDENGNWGVNDLEYDTATVLNLTIQVLVSNVSSFFDESLLRSLTETFSDTSLQGAKI